MTKQHIKATYAKLDPAHAFDGLFVPTAGKKRGRLFVKPRQFGDIEIGFQGFEQLGANDQSILLAITAQLGIDGLTIEADPTGPVSKQLRLALEFDEDDGAPVASKKTSFRSLLRDAGQHPDAGTNDAKESLNRLRNAQIREVNRVTGWDRASQLISVRFNTKTGEVHIAANPRLTQAVFAGQHIKVSLFERNALKSDVAKLLHCWLCTNVRLGKSLGNGRGATLETLAKHVWGMDAWDKFAIPDKSKKRAQIRSALIEIEEKTRSLQRGTEANGNGWAIEITKSGVAFVSRPKELPYIEGELDMSPGELYQLMDEDEREARKREERLQQEMEEDPQSWMS